MKRRGFTMVESMVGLVLAFGVLSLLYTFLGRMNSSSKPSVTRMTTASFVRQDVRIAFQKLMDRLEEGIEILSPAPGGTGAELQFKDLLNHTIDIGKNARGELVTYRVRNGAREEENVNQTIPVSTGRTAAPVRAIRVPAVRNVQFQVVSPTLVTIVLTVSDSSEIGTLVATARLRNSRLADL